MSATPPGVVRSDVGGSERADPVARVVVASLIAAGCAAIYVATRRYGAATLPDSPHYLAMARSLAADGSLRDVSGALCSLWPWLYPALLAAAGLVAPLTPNGAPVLLGMVGYAVTVGFSCRWLFLVCRTRLFRIVGAGILATSSSLLVLMSGMLSEVPYLPAVAIYLYTVFAPGLSPNRRFAILLGCAAVATMSRYMGAYLYPLAGLIWLLHQVSSGRRFAGVGAAFGLGVLSLLPVIAMFVRNHLATGSLVGARPGPSFDAATQLRMAVETLTTYPFPASVPLWVRIPLWALLIGVGVWFAMRRIRLRGGGLDPSVASVLFAVVWSAYFIATSLVMAMRVHTDTFEHRMLTPVSMPLWLVLLYGLENLAVRRRALRVLAVAFAAGLLLLSAQRAYKLVHRGMTTGLGMYTSVHFAEDPIVRAVSGLGDDAFLISNAADALYLYSYRHLHMIPPVGADVGAGLERLRVMAAGRPIYFLWLRDFWRPYTSSPERVREAGVPMVPVREEASGIMFRLWPDEIALPE